MTPDLDHIYVGDALTIMRSWPDNFIQCCVTSPPYWGLRDYGIAGQLGMEPSPEEYVTKMVEVFREVKRVLRDDATFWLNIGDTFADSGKGSYAGPKQATNVGSVGINPFPIPSGLKSKDLIGIPWRLAFALQSDGWYLRSDVIWSKNNPMPESVTDRPTKSHEYLFLLTKNPTYYYDNDAIKEPAIYFDLADDGPNKSQIFSRDHPERAQNPKALYKDARSYEGKHSDKQRGHGRRHAGFNERWDAMTKIEQCQGMRNKRSVWTVPTMGFPEAHFATFPPNLIKPCVLAGSRQGDIVFDPFMGSGTTALVALQYNRKFLGIELNPIYVEMAYKRIAAEQAQVKMAI